MHVTYVVLHEMIGARLYGVHRTQNTPRREQFHVAQAMSRCKYTTSVDIQKIYASHSCHAESHASAVSLLESGQ